MNLVMHKPGAGSRAGNNALSDALLSRLPENVAASLTEVQRSAIEAAARQCQWGDHPLDIRLTVPTPFGVYYFVVIGGRERRDRARRVRERASHPLWTWRNAIFLMPLTAIIFSGGALLGMALVGFIKSVL